MAIRVIGAPFWATSRAVVGSRLCLWVGGVVGVFLGGTFGLFIVMLALDLPLAFVSLSFPLFFVEIGHWYLFIALYEVNLYPYCWYCYCGLPFMASLAKCWASYLNIWFLFLTSCFFFFWAFNIRWGPFVRSKKALEASLLSISKMYANITFFTLSMGWGTSAAAHLTRWVWY